MRTEVGALAVAARHPEVPRLAKLVAVLVVAYALSPIDLVPDVLPVVGLLDDLVLVPLGILLVRRMIPDHVLAECRVRAVVDPPRASRGGIALVVLAWLLLLGLAWIFLGSRIGA